MREDDAAYFRKRALQEQLAAQQTSCEAARIRHDELTIMYQFRAAMLSEPSHGWADALDEELAAEGA